MIAPRLPSHDELRPFLDRLESNPGSVVLIAVEWQRDVKNYAEAKVGFFDADARARLRRALQGEKRREKAEVSGTDFSGASHSETPSVRNIAGPIESEKIPYGGVSS